ncbi:MAG: sulfatase-like hydrolase/transferase [Verrucomicrobiales bacterium]|nr:sulfatase-like hydrolase/transferase [Verrucomicrobiales bacterium]
MGRLAGMLLLTGGAALEAQPAKPNILFLFADDQCFDTIRARRNLEVRTPNLDRLVAAGTTFSHAYNMGAWSGAVCIPSRTMLNTGRFLWPVQALDKNLEPEREAGRLWGLEMRSAGYDTYFTGKWHVKTDVAKVFDVARHERPGMPKDTPQGYDRPKPGEPDSWRPWDPQFGGYWEGGRHWSEVVGDDATDYLATAAQRTAPFFMYIAFNAPHDPRQSPREYVEMYPLERIAVPVNFLPEYPWKEAIGCGTGLRDERLAPFPRTEYAVKVHRQEYYAIITHMDAQIGRILKALEQSGKADNTWIFFTADHGLAVGHHGLIGKQNLFDHSVRVPLIAVGPGVPAGRRIDAPVYLQDVMPTAIELAGRGRRDYIQFHSLLPLLRGAAGTSAYDAVYGAYLNLQRSITCDGYKLLLYPKVPKALLFDLEKDPQEMKDLAEQPGSAAIMKRLWTRFRALQREMEDPLDLRGVFPELD